MTKSVGYDIYEEYCYTMDKAVEKIFEKVLFKPASVAIIWPIFLIASVGALPEDFSQVAWKTYATIAVYLLVAIIYTMICIKKNQLPTGRDRDSSILFVIDAENHQLFQEVKAKLVSEFDNYSHKGFEAYFEAVCVEKQKVSKYDTTKSSFAISLLEKTNCIFLINVRYTVDSATNAEHYKMETDYGFVHPAIDEKARKEFLQTDIINLQHSICSRKFDKAHLIDEMSFTAVSLNIICRYLIGLAALLSGKFSLAYSLLHDLYYSISATGNVGRLPKDFYPILKNRLFFSCIQLAVYYQNQFYLEKDDKYLNRMDVIIEEANGLYPNTYDYNLMKAYILVAQDGSLAKVKHCIEMCKKSNVHDNWKYNEAFVAAYEGNPGLEIYRKYVKAFSADQELMRIAVYIEFILDKKPELSSLHLAAGLVYDKIGDASLAKSHFDQYFQSTTDKPVQNILVKRKKWVPPEYAK